MTTTDADPTTYHGPDGEPQTLPEFITAHGITGRIYKADEGTKPPADFAGARCWRVRITNARGEVLTTPFYTGAAIDRPTVADVLACLASDYIEDGTTFEQWADEMGYDTDSRKALATFHAVEEQSRALSAWCARPALVDELRAAAQDY
jgi:hypothetical protein